MERTQAQVFSKRIRLHDTKTQPNHRPVTGSSWDGWCYILWWTPTGLINTSRLPGADVIRLTCCYSQSLFVISSGKHSRTHTVNTHKHTYCNNIHLYACARTQFPSYTLEKIGGFGCAPSSSQVKVKWWLSRQITARERQQHGLSQAGGRCIEKHFWSSCINPGITCLSLFVCT